ncbi:MAG TPA: potassium channel family protein [Acidobacteriaceae bacterium]
MRAAALIAGLLFCLSAILDAFQTIILPRRPTGRFRITRLFYIVTWSPWAALARHTRNPKVREQIYSTFGPGSLLLLLIVWALLLIAGFGLLFFGLRTPFGDAMADTSALARLRTDLYVSGTTLFTLGIGDVLPRSLAARVLIVVESGTGLGFVALVIGYVPVLYGSFSRREISVALLDARAGSPPTSTELLRRHAFPGGQEALVVLLVEWERWSAEILESHISYPILCYYRSQHDNQSWLSALTAVLDSCALLISVVPGVASRQAQLTFAMARHALVDLGHVFHLEKNEAGWRASGSPDRLPPENFGRVCDLMQEAGMQLCGDPEASARLHALRALYEPHAQAIGYYLGMSLPGWIPEPRAKDQWKTVEEVRSKAASVLKKSSVISDQAVAVRPHSEDHH